MTKNAAVDLGYGWTKALASGRTWAQPSVLGDSRPLFDESIREDDVRYNDLFVGSLALRHSEVRYFSTKETKAATWTTEVLLRAALSVVAPDDVVNLVTGLPVDYYFSQKAAFEKLLTEFRPDTATVTLGREAPRRVCPVVNRFKLVPQPLGAAMDFLLDDQGGLARREEARGRILVIDLGYYTLDLLVLEDGREINKASCSPPGLGVDTAYRLLQGYLKEQLGKAPARYELDRYVIAGNYEGYDIRPLVQKAFRTLAGQLQLEIDGLNMTFTRSLLAGGAMPQVAEYLDVPNKYLLPSPQLANLRGYGKIAARTWRPL